MYDQEVKVGSLVSFFLPEAAFGNAQEGHNALGIIAGATHYNFTVEVVYPEKEVPTKVLISKEKLTHWGNFPSARPRLRRLILFIEEMHRKHQLQRERDQLQKERDQLARDNRLLQRRIAILVEENTKLASEVASGVNNEGDDWGQL